MTNDRGRSPADDRVTNDRVTNDRESPMAVSSTETMPLGTAAPPFSLTEVSDGSTVTLAEVSDGPALVVAFLCRHCPYVKHVEHAFAQLATTYQQQGVRFVGISANDPQLSPDDAPGSLAEQKQQVGFTFPYLFDADQSVAAAYGAVCTPDVFVFDAATELAYRGRIDATRPGQGEASGDELAAVLDVLLKGEEPPADHPPSMGCSIKWSPGNEPN